MRMSHSLTGSKSWEFELQHDAHNRFHPGTHTVFSPDPVLFPYFTMKVLAIALALTAVLATVSAECPNACSGHGDCTLYCSSCEAAHHGAVC